MDNAPQEEPRKPTTSSRDTDYEGSTDDDDDDDDFGRLKAWLANEPETPTKKRPGTREIDETPRPSKSVSKTDETPRATMASDKDAASSALGFTLSHLRRVPELGLLAQRVVEAEAKRRAKEERKKQKEQAAQPQAKGLSSTSTSGYKPSSAILKSAGPTSAKPGEPKAAKMKRLFRYAIRQLYEEGSIVLWDGPVRPLPIRPLPSLSLSIAAGSRSTNKLWKSNVSSSTGQPSASAFSSVSQQGEDDEDVGDLSDPPKDEEAYVPLSQAYLCRIVEGAIKDIMSRPLTRRLNGWKSSGPPPGPTPEEITSHLRRRDERWARVGDWAVKEALEWGKIEGRVWCIGDSRWEICG